MRILIYLIFAVQLAVAMPGASHAAAPLTLSNIETLLRSKVSSKRVAQLVDERKVTIKATAATTRKLMELGAAPSLITAIRENGVTSLQLDSAPPGAEAFLNGRYRGKTPLFLERVVPGIYELQVGKLEGYLDCVDEMVLLPGEPAKKSVVLQRRPGQPAAEQVAAKERDRAAPVPAPHPKTPSPPPQRPVARPADERQLVPVSVGTEPVSAQIYLDGKYIAASPADFLVTVGSHQLRLVPVGSTGYETLEKEIQVKVDALNAHRLRLTSKMEN